MSDSQQGPGWWLASDGRWYPPEAAPGVPASPAVAPPDYTPPVAPPVMAPPPFTPPPGSVGTSPSAPKKNRRLLYLAVAAFVVVVVVIAAVAGSGKKSAKVAPASAAPTTAAPQATTIQSASSAPTVSVAGTTTPEPPQTAPPTTPVTAAPAPTIAPINLSGTGQSATSAFTVTDGLAVVHSTCSCSGNFSIELLTSAGDSTDVPVNVIGAYDGSKGENLSGGSYVMKIDADAAWKVTITQPRGVPGAALPHTYAGKGQQIVGPFDAGSAARLQAQNTAGPGGGNFAVELIGSDGSNQDVPFNQIGSFSGSTISNNLSNGPYYLNVDSDGTWTIAVSAP